MKIFDITVPIRATMPVYEGDPGVNIEPWSAFAKGDSANVSMLHFGAHTGTHVGSARRNRDVAGQACCRFA